MQRAEEGLREYYEFCDLGANEASSMQTCITAAVDESFEISESKTYRRLQGIRVKAALTKIIDMAKLIHAVVPVSAIELELKQKFVLEVCLCSLYLYQH